MILLAFDLKTRGAGFSTASDGNFTSAATNHIINAYASIKYLSKKVIRFGSISDSNKFTVGTQILLHVAGYKGSAATCKARGYWGVFIIKAIDGEDITLNRSASGMTQGFSLGDLYLQAVTVPNYKTLTLKADTSLTAPKFDYSKGYGGVVAFKATDFVMNGGHIDLATCGFPDATNYAKGIVNGETDNAILRDWSGWENGRTLQHLTINYPGGACFIIADNWTCDPDSRIGSLQWCEGVARSNHGDFKVNPSTRKQGSPDSGTGRLYHGGSSIFLAAQVIKNFNEQVIAKTFYPNSTTLGTSGISATDAKGYGRCLIATETTLPCDEALYAYDRISSSERMQDSINISNFGDGSDGSRTNYTKQLNSYCAVTAIDKTRKIFTVGSITNNGLATFKAGALIMIHVSPKKYVQWTGRFMLAKVVGITLNKITIDTEFPAESGLTPANYEIQLVAIPQFANFTLSKSNAATPKYQNGCGGILAIAVNDTCDLSGGALNVFDKGGAIAYGEKGLDYVSNASCCERLPLGEGNGSVFILAKNLTMTAATRIGATYSGANLAGLAWSSNSKAYIPDSKYQWVEGGFFYGLAANLGRINATNSTDTKLSTMFGTNGGALRAGSNFYANNTGGFGSSSTAAKNNSSSKDFGGRQGAHIFIVADKITGFNIAALSTGGEAGYNSNGKRNTTMNGGAGYGGAGGSAANDEVALSGGNGGVHGGGGGAGGTDEMTGGGSSGFAFVYCNSDSDTDYSNIIRD